MKTVHVARRRLAWIVPLVCAASAVAGVAQPAAASPAAPVPPRFGAVALRPPALLAPQATTVAVSTPANPVYSGTSITFSAMVLTGNGDGVSEGVVAFADWGRLLGVGGSQGGQAGYTTSGLASGLHSIKAYYIGTQVYAPSNSPALYLLVQAD